MRFHTSWAGKAYIFISLPAPAVYSTWKRSGLPSHYPVCVWKACLQSGALYPSPEAEGAEIFSRVTRPASSLPCSNPAENKTQEMAERKHQLSFYVKSKGCADVPGLAGNFPQSPIRGEHAVREPAWEVARRGQASTQPSCGQETPGLGLLRLLPL